MSTVLAGMTQVLEPQTLPVTVAMRQCSVAKIHKPCSIWGHHSQIQGEGRVTVMREEEGKEVMEGGGNERFEGMC